MQIGYARVSTDDRDTAAQVAALKKAEFEGQIGKLRDRLHSAALDVRRQG